MPIVPQEADFQDSPLKRHEERMRKKAGTKPAQPTPQVPSPLGRQEQRLREEAAVFNLLIGEKRVDPSTAIRILKMERKTGLPTDLIIDSLEEVEREASKADFDAQAFRRNSPLTWNYIRNNPVYADLGLSIEEVVKLGGIEKLLSTPLDLLPMTERMVRKEVILEVEQLFGGNFEESLARRMAKEPDPVIRADISARMHATRISNIERLVANRLEDEKFISRTDKIGFAEQTRFRLRENPLGFVPFLTSLGDFTRYYALLEAVEAQQAGTATDRQANLLKRFARMNAAMQRRGFDVRGKIARITSELPAIVGEFFVGMPAFTATRAAILRGGTKAVGELIETTAKKSVGRRVTAFIGGVTAINLVKSPPRVAVGTVERLLPGIAVIPDEFGELQAVLSDDQDGFMSAFTRAFGSQWVEDFSEFTGFLVAGAAAPLKRFVLHRWLRINPGRSIPQALARLEKRAAWDGLIGEMFEERVSGFGQALIEGETVGASLAGQTPAIFGGKMTGDDLLAEAVAFAIPGTAGAALSLVTSRERERPETNPAFFIELRRIVKQMKAKDPATIEQAIGQVTSRFREYAYIPLETWVDVWRKQKDLAGAEMDPREAYREIMGDTVGYDHAVENGIPNLQFPMEKYAAHISTNDAVAEFFQSESKLDPLESTPQEREALEKEIAEFKEALRKAKAEKPPVEEAPPREPAAPVEIPKEGTAERRQVNEAVVQFIEEEKPKGVPDIEFVEDTGEVVFAGTENVISIRELLSKEQLAEIARTTLRPEVEPPAEVTPAVRDEVDLAPPQESTELLRGEGVRKQAEGPLDPKPAGIPVPEAPEVPPGVSPQEASVEKVRKEVEQQFLRLLPRLLQLPRLGGFNQQDIRAYSEFEGERARTRAEIMKRDPWEMFREEMIKFGVDLGEGPASPTTGKVFEQPTEPEGVGPRGRTRIGPFGINVDLLRNADVSTLFHEGGHRWLDEMQRDIEILEGRDPETLTPSQQRLIEDGKIVLDFLGVKTWDEVRPEVEHEKWANGVETFIREGRAPSEKLKRPMMRFVRFMTRLFKTLLGMRVNLTPEVREVMGRLFASEVEVESAFIDEQMEPMITNPRVAGLTEEQADRYETLLQEHKTEALERVANRLMEKVRRRERKEFKAERKKLREEVARQKAKEPVQIALSVLSTGVRPDGTLHEFISGLAPYKLSRPLIVREFTEAVANSLPASIMAKEGVSADTAAPDFGFNNGPEFIAELNRIYEESRQDSPAVQQEQEILNKISVLESQAEEIRRAGETRASETKLVKKALTAGKRTLANALATAEIQKERAGVAILEERLKFLRDTGVIPTQTGITRAKLPQRFRAKEGQGLKDDAWAQDMFQRGIIDEPRIDDFYDWLADSLETLKKVRTRAKQIPAEARHQAAIQIKDSIKILTENAVEQAKLKDQLRKMNREIRRERRALEVKVTFDSVVDRETDRIMEERFPDLETDEELREETINAIHNDKKAQLNHMELVLLVSRDGPAFRALGRLIARTPKKDVQYRADAETTIRNMEVRAINLHQFQIAERKHRRAAVIAFTKGDFEAAFDAKEKELKNYELYIAGRKIKEAEEKGVKLFKRIMKTASLDRIGRAGHNYREILEAMADEYGLRRSRGKTLDGKTTLEAWMKDTDRDTAFLPDIPKFMLSEAGRKPYRELQAGQMVELFQAARQIHNQAREWGKLLDSVRKQGFEEATDEIEASIAAHHDITAKPVSLAKSFIKLFGETVDKGIAAHWKMEFLFEFLDGEQALGPVWEYFFLPVTKAQDRKNELNLAMRETLNRILKPFKRRERARWMVKKIYVPEAKTEVFDGQITLAGIISIGLNQGNQYNRQAILEGYGWTQTQVNALLRHLTKKHKDMIQEIWKYLDTFWAEAAALERDITGRTPEKVEGDVLDGGAFDGYDGGYYPLIFDSKLSWRQETLDEKASVQEMFGGNWLTAMTKHNHLKERSNSAGKPPLLELTVFTEHLSAMVHDLAYRRAVMDVWRLVNDSKVRKAITAAAGIEVYKLLNPWIHAIARDRDAGYLSIADRLWSKARRVATIVNLGLKVASGLLQFLGYFRTVKELGVKYSAIGLKEFWGRPWDLGKNWKFIVDNSVMMGSRMSDYDRDVRDLGKKMDIVSGAKQAWFYHIGIMDLGVSSPSWMGAYRKAMDGNVKNIKEGDHKNAVLFADRTVRITQSAGTAKDLAAVQRGPESWKIWTMFYTEMSTQINQYMKLSRQFKLERNVPKLIGGLITLWIVPALMEEIIRGRVPDDEEDIPAWLLRKELLYPFDSVVLLRDISNALDMYYETGRIDVSGPAVLQAGEAFVQATALTTKLLSGDEITRTDLRGAAFAAGYVGSLPSRQLWQTGEYLHDWLTGLEEPDNPIEGVWRALVIGKPRE